jgi:hypothetical protein
MKINTIDKKQFYKITQDHKKFLDRIKDHEIFIVKKILDPSFCISLRNESFTWGQESESSWHPFFDNCPDYHRLHDNYPNAHVQQKFHAFYRHNYQCKNNLIFHEMKDLFILKNRLAGFEDNEFFNNVPSNGIVPRINVHHYPIGGGYQAEHIDPSGPFAQIQTLIAASKFGSDYKTGGVYARKNKTENKLYIDHLTDIGDMMVLSPSIPHGVSPIDSNEKYSPHLNNGRWIILPLFLYSDYPHEDNLKPKQV